MTTALRLGRDKYPAQGITAAGASTTLDLDVRQASARRPRPSAITKTRRPA
ncbi:MULTISPECIES: hypothetical protein [Thermomonospora]|uniref:Uncharacterized protein n=1 Tax=Thermomonospora cellulosilytica TaxID=1411118 RepID=A0A7W3MTL4_9ACTN|nr:MULTISPECIES: hypothetical protein [Thermomonospora]MBA9001677.1 hypothetical protein [Thermomonospora cellulosilytica]